MPKRLFMLDDTAEVFLAKNVPGMIRNELQEYVGIRSLQKISIAIRQYIRAGEPGTLKFFFCSVETMQELIKK